MRYYFVRHGESEANILREFSNRGYKHGLTGKGREQARALSRAITVPVLQIWTSPLQRAVETAQILSTAWGVPYEKTDALREFDCGLLEGRSDQAAWQQHSDVLSAWFERGDLTYRIEGGESLLDIKARFFPFIERLIDRLGGGPGNVVLVGHGGTFLAMLPLLFSNVDLSFSSSHGLGNTAYVLAEPGAGPVTSGCGMMLCLEWCGIQMVPGPDQDTAQS